MAYLAATSATKAAWAPGSPAWIGISSRIAQARCGLLDEVREAAEAATGFGQSI
jgi:hypothetical protein